ncbi:hypothetical protein LOK49_LG10G01596 [Camellia lanceoleosa]|uniref:Uncharacterized protein n=1 Tax=Camellia lanceoleosa TaxID=1840588 RepID=A0ACC0GE57_9ERIC|nr:hypothetical protein LOK49_LG10G01596 [Camellia lanceoleosa]
MPGVVSVFPNNCRRLYTTHSWDFMGLLGEETMEIPGYSTKKTCLVDHKGKTRARDAALNAIQSPLLDIGIERATGIVWNITGGSDLTLYEGDYFSDAISVGSFHAVSHGIVVVSSVGNEGNRGSATYAQGNG